MRNFSRKKEEQRRAKTQGISANTKPAENLDSSVKGDDSGGNGEKTKTQNAW